MLYLRYCALTALASIVFAATANAGTVRARSGARAHVADGAVPKFQCLVDALEHQGYRIKFMGGYRKHGSVRGSLHPVGLALDINQFRRNVTRPRMPRDEIELANTCGLVAGAQWSNADSGHFQVGGWAGRKREHVASRSKTRNARSASVDDVAARPAYPL